jgi:MinD-like ATPase involved in chromosome partitioning or flagellar assembly
MTERQGEHSDDQASPAPRPPEFPERFANPSGPVPRRPESDPPQPPSAENDPSGDPAPGLGGGALRGDALSSDPLTFDKLFKWPEQPGSQHKPVAQDPSRQPDRFPPHEQQPSDTATRPGEPTLPHAPPIGPQDVGGPGKPVAQATSPPDRFPSHEQQPSDTATRPSHGDTPHSGPLPTRPGPPWPQQRGRWPPDDQGFNHAQGWVPNTPYVDSIRSSELLHPRRIPPGRGWRKVVYIASFKLVNLGQSPDERYQGELETKIRSPLRGTYKIGVLGKGGVGKSTVSASVGSVFAELRQDDRVVAIDADTGFGKLASRIDPAASGSYWELATDSELFRFSDVRSRVGNNKSGLFVLPGEAATARRRILDVDIYRKATSKLDRHFTLSVVDCGSTLDSPVTREVLADVDALIVVSSPWYDGASAAGQILDWLANNGYTGLLHRTVVVVNDSDDHAGKRRRALLVERFGGGGQKVIEMPFDENLRFGGVIDVGDGLNRLTRRRVVELAAACAEHFAATAGRPRVYDGHRRQGGHRRLRDADPGVEPGAAPGR